MSSLELISFRLCPFVQRAMIVLVLKDIEHTVTFIDLGDPPDWFHKVSPRGKVPVLRVGDDLSIFEAAVIAEYLDEVKQPPLMPTDPLTRALNRSWIEYATTALMPLRDLTTVETSTALQGVIDGFQSRLDPVEEVLESGPYFNGSNFSLVDATYAPMFVRLDYFSTYLDDFIPLVRFPKLAAWRAAVTGLPAVQKTIGDDFAALMDQLIANRQGHLATLLPGDVKTSGPRRDY